MKYKYIAGLLVALSFNSGFAAVADADEGNYQQIYDALRAGGHTGINAALKNNQDFNYRNDVAHIARSCEAGRILRTNVIGLPFAKFKDVVETNHEFFKTSLGVSLVYGWTLKWFSDVIPPCNIGYSFSFKKLFKGMVDRGNGDVNVKTFLESAFTRGLVAVENDRRAFYSHMLYLPSVIEQVRAAMVAPDDGGVEPLLSMDIVTVTWRSTLEAQTEAVDLARAPGRAVFLDVVADPADDTKSGCADLAETQEYILLRPDLFDPRTKEQETFISLPAGTPETYEFMGRSVAAHMAVFKAIDLAVHGGGHDGEHEAVDLHRAKYLDMPVKDIKILTETVLGYEDVTTLIEFKTVMKVACETDLSCKFPKEELNC